MSIKIKMHTSHDLAILPCRNLSTQRLLSVRRNAYGHSIYTNNDLKQSKFSK